MINCFPRWNILPPVPHLHPCCLPRSPSKTRRHRHPSLSFSLSEKVNNIEEIKIHYVLSGVYRALCWNNGRGGRQKDKRLERKDGRRVGVGHSGWIMQRCNNLLPSEGMKLFRRYRGLKRIGHNGPAGHCSHLHGRIVNINPRRNQRDNGRERELCRLKNYRRKDRPTFDDPRWLNACSNPEGFPSRAPPTGIRAEKFAR